MASELKCDRFPQAKILSSCVDWNRLFRGQTQIVLPRSRPLPADAAPPSTCCAAWPGG